jgi:hypothetical protein
MLPHSATTTTTVTTHMITVARIARGSEAAGRTAASAVHSQTRACHPCTTNQFRFYSKHSSFSARSKPPPPAQHSGTTFTHGDSSRAPRPSTTRNLVTFLAASALGVGAYMYQWQKHPSSNFFKNPFSTPDTLTNEKWTPILLKKITPVSEHTSLFDFELAHPCTIPISSAIYVKDDEIQAMRAYTPVHSTVSEQSTLQLLIKRYSEGQVSRFMHAARPGQKIEMRGPVVIWPGSPSDLEQWDEIGMVRSIRPVLIATQRCCAHVNERFILSVDRSRRLLEEQASRQCCPSSIQY